MLVFLKFYFYPDAFNQFRYSFKRQLKATNHYYIHTIALIVAILLLNIISFSQLGSLGLFIIIIIYTLVYKPYLKNFDNFRSAFNYFVMCSFLGFSIYVNFCIAGNLNKFPTYIFLIINFVLLFAVVLIGIFSSLYFWRYETFIKPKLDQVYKNSKKYVEHMRRYKLLQDLIKINTKTQIQKVKLQTVFKRIIQPNQNIIEASHRYKQEQLFRKQQKLILNLNSSRTINPMLLNNSPSNAKQKYGQIKKIMESQRIQAVQNKKQNQQLNKFSKKINKTKYIELQNITTEKSNDGPQYEIKQKIQSAKDIAIDVLMQQSSYIHLKAVKQIVDEQKKKIGKFQQVNYLDLYDNIQSIENDKL